MRELWTTEQQLNAIAKLEGDMAMLLNEAEGFFFTDHGYQPTPLVQARLRFKEATMWAKSWIESQK